VREVGTEHWKYSRWAIGTAFIIWVPSNIFYLLVGARVWQLALTPDEKLLYATNGNSNDVSVIEVANRKVVKTIAVGAAPIGVVVSPK